MPAGYSLSEAPTGYSFGTLAPDAATAAGLTIPQGSGDVPPLRAVLTVEGNPVRYRYDGAAPTATVGHAAGVGDAIVIEGYANLKQLKVIATTGTASLPYTLER